jgi:hypothetical protein
MSATPRRHSLDVVVEHELPRVGSQPEVVPITAVYAAFCWWLTTVVFGHFRMTDGLATAWRLRTTSPPDEVPLQDEYRAATERQTPVLVATAILTP